MISFEEWVRQNEVTIRQIQDKCPVGHAEGGEDWWDTAPYLECMGCGAMPGQEHADGCDEEMLSEFPDCDCNARVLYAKTQQGQNPLTA